MTVEACAAQSIAEEMTLRELRHVRKLAQVRMSEKDRGHTGMRFAMKKAGLSPKTVLESISDPSARKGWDC